MTTVPVLLATNLNKHKMYFLLL